jgi:hypothetical protein
MFAAPPLPLATQPPSLQIENFFASDQFALFFLKALEAWLIWPLRGLHVLQRRP